jgi:DNA polymerase-3 subunit alpha
VIAPEPLVNYTPLQFGPGREAVITQYDMKAVQEVGLLKMDFLGLQNLDIISSCLRLVKQNRGVEIDIDRIPLDDAKTYELISAADTHGVFQLEGAGMRRMLTEMRPSRFEDVIVAIALFRPGPMQDIPAYVARKHGREPIEYLHPWLEPILGSTYGVFTYQEQVMEAARVLAGFTLSEADILRSAMGKKDRVKMAQQREKFIKGAIAKGIDHGMAEQLFDRIAMFASYGFNKSHSAAYAVVSYQTAYLKANYPLEYMTSLLIHMEGSADKVATAIVDCRARNIDVLPPDINQSGSDFSIVGGNIRFGLAAIKNVGAKAVELIVQERDENGPFNSLQDLCDRIAGIQDVNRRVLESLVRCGACDVLGERNLLLFNLERTVARAESARRDRETGQASLFGDEVHTSDVLESAEPMSDEEKLRAEKELLGLYLSDHPLRRIAPELARLTDTQAVEVTSEIQDSEVRVGGLVREVRRVVTRKGQIMAYATLEDLTGSIDVILFPRVYEQFRQLFEPEKVLVVQGKVDARAGGGRNVAASQPDPDEETVEAFEVASVVAELVWNWDDPDCVPVDRRQVVHVDMPAGDDATLDSVLDVLARHPGDAPVFIHVELPGHLVTIQAGDRFHVAAGAALEADFETLFARRVTRLETVRPRAQANGNGRGKR